MRCCLPSRVYSGSHPLFLETVGTWTYGYPVLTCAVLKSLVCLSASVNTEVALYCINLSRDLTPPSHVLSNDMFINGVGAYLPRYGNFPTGSPFFERTLVCVSDAQTFIVKTGVENGRRLPLKTSLLVVNM